MDRLVTSIVFLIEVTALTFTLTGGWHAFSKKAVRVNSDRHLMRLVND